MEFSTTANAMKASLPYRGVYFVPKFTNCPKMRQAHDAPIYNCNQICINLKKFGKFLI